MTARECIPRAAGARLYHRRVEKVGRLENPHNMGLRPLLFNPHNMGVIGGLRPPKVRNSLLVFCLGPLSTQLFSGLNSRRKKMEAADSLANANADAGHEHDAVHALLVLEATTRAYQDALSIQKDTKVNCDASQNAADSAKKIHESARIASSIAWANLADAINKVNYHARERDLATSTQEGKFFVIK